MAVTSVTITLRRPVRAHGQEIDSLTLREPTGDDITVCGYPLQMADGAATPIATAITKYIARLGDVPASTVKALAVQDYSACLGAILGFFGTSEEDLNQPPGVDLD